MPWGVGLVALLGILVVASAPAASAGTLSNLLGA